MRKSHPTFIATLFFVLSLAFAAHPASAYVYELQRVYISSYQTGGSGDSGLPQGYYDLAIAGEWPDELVGVLRHKGEIVAADIDLEATGCREGRARAQGRFERPASAGARVVVLVVIAELDVPGARKRRVCDLKADLPLPPGPGGLTTLPKPPQHDKPDTGPGQGGAPAAALPNLRIRSAEEIPPGGTDLEVVVVNTGAGVSAATKLKLIYIRSGKALTAFAAVPALAAGQQTTVQVGVGQPLAKADKVNLRVDDPNTVSETDEGDNGFIYSN